MFLKKKKTDEQQFWEINIKQKPKQEEWIL